MLGPDVLALNAFMLFAMLNATMCFPLSYGLTWINNYISITNAVGKSSPRYVLHLHGLLSHLMCSTLIFILFFAYIINMLLKLMLYISSVVVSFMYSH